MSVCLWSVSDAHPLRCIGTGKTATFAIGILQQLDISMRRCQALVLAPTRELAQQIVKVISSLGDFMSIKIHACVGGTAVREDVKVGHTHAGITRLRSLTRSAMLRYRSYKEECTSWSAPLVRPCQSLVFSVRPL